MNVLTPGSTSSRVSAVSPVQWLRAFAYTPDSTRAVQKNGSQHSERSSPNYEDEDTLPTRFHSGVPDTMGHVEDAYVSAPSSTVPTKHKRCSGRGALSLVSSVTSEYNTTTTHGSPSRRKTRTSGRSDCGQGLGGTSHAGSSRCLRSRRIVLDAVEIVGKRPQSRVTDSKTGSVHQTIPGSYYPSPPASRVMHDDHPMARVHSPRANAAVRHDGASPSPHKTSKYFAHASVSSGVVIPPVPTPPSSPALAIPVYTESSDFEYPLLDSSFDEPTRGTVDESRHMMAWYDNPGLSDDLMIMLRRLKPILVQESIQDDPWKVLIAVRLLNVTTGKAAIPVFCKIISRWPTPEDLVHAPYDELVELLKPLGLYNKRARWLKDISKSFLEAQQIPGYTSACAHHLRYPGVGPYALDSLGIFCATDKDAWKHVMPRDKELVRYLRWRWAVEEGKMWYPGGRGVIGDVNVPYLITLVDELASHYDGAIGDGGYMYHFCNDLCGALSADVSG